MPRADMISPRRMTNDPETPLETILVPVLCFAKVHGRLLVAPVSLECVAPQDMYKGRNVA
jgi:hypothetical protein